MILDIHPDDLKVGDTLTAHGRTFVVEDAADSRVLESVCKAARAAVRTQMVLDFFHGDDVTVREPSGRVVVPEKPLHVNGDGLDGLVRDAFVQLYRKHDGDESVLVPKLRVSRSTFYAYRRKFAELLVGVAACVLVGCGSVPAARTTNLSPSSSPLVIDRPAIAASLLPQAADVPPNRLHTRFAFDASPDASVTGYRLYYGPESRVYTNSVDLGTNLAVTIEHDAYPIIAAATAYNADGDESEFSSEAGILGTQTIVRGYDQRADSPDGPFADAGLVFTRTNPPTTFHRLRIESRNELVTYP